MKFNLKEILHLYYLQEVKTHGTLFTEPVYQHHKVDSEKLFQQFMGFYNVPLRGEADNGYKYNLAVMQFSKKGFDIQTRLARRALVIQLDFLPGLPKLPAKQAQKGYGIVYNSDLEARLNWAEEIEAKHGICRDINIVDKVIPPNDPSVQKLLLLKENFMEQMTKKGFNLQRQFGV